MDIGRIRTCLLKKIRCDRGSLIVEAAIFLPVFIIAVLSLAMVMRYMETSDQIDRHLMDEARLAGMEAHFIPPEVAAALLQYKAYDLDNSDFWAEASEATVADGDTILLKADYKVKNKLPLDYIGRRLICEKVLVRVWTGSSGSGAPMPWQEMERDGNSEPVFVFPRAGEKYHKQSCIFVANTPSEKLLTPELKRKYDPCRNCDAKETPDYSLVYCFMKSGQVYHLYRCPLVDKFVVEIDKTDAEERGYEPCKKCQ